MSEDIFTKRGISEEIWKARPYTRWETDDLDPVRAAYGGLGSAGLAFALRIAEQSPGYLIERFPPEGLGLDPIYPEFRPDNAVRTGWRRWHQHVRGNAQAGALWPMLLGKPLSDHETRGFGYVYNADGFVEVKRTPKSPTDHLGINVPRSDFHYHEPWAKYVFPTAGRIDRTWTHDHRVKWHDHEGYSDKWIARHVAAEHGGSEAAWHGQRHEHARAWDEATPATHIARGHGAIDVDSEHLHTSRVKDKNSNLARRLDVHPAAMEKLRTAEVVFFAIEGCMKADAILAKGAAVFSVPSVSLWDCQELKAFVVAYLNGKEVVIVPDADWAANAQVVSQARLCHAALNRYGVARAHCRASRRQPRKSRQG